VGDVASPGSAFEIAAILYFPLVETKDRVVYLYPPNPDCRLWGECDPAALYFAANFFRSPHVCLSLFVYQNDFPCSLCIGIRACVCIIQAFQETVPCNVGFKAVGVCFAAAGELAI
jgi:hypothetical protein